MERKNKDTNPIYYKNAEEMDKPLSELMEGLRMEIDKTRGKMHDIKRSYGWEDRIEPLEGGLTCMLMSMYSIMLEFKEFEEKNKQSQEELQIQRLEKIEQLKKIILSNREDKKELIDKRCEELLNKYNGFIYKK